MLALPVAVAFIFVLAACGSDSKDKAPSKAAYITSADNICRAGNKVTNGLTANLTKDSTEADFATFKAAIVPALRGQTKSLRALKTPSGDAAKLKGIYDQVDAATAKLAATAPADVPAFFNSDPYAAPNKAAVDYGFKECGK
jgi:uncharacterized lipoprotein